MSVAVAVTTNIQTKQQAQAAMTDFLKNPPVNPTRAVEWLSKNFNLTGSVGSALSFAPGIASFAPLLSGIFNAFSSGPSIGELTLQGLSNISMQITNLKAELEGTIQKTAELERVKTVDYVLQGVDEISKQESAAAQMIDMLQAEQVRADLLKKTELYSDYLAESVKTYESAMSDLTKSVNAARDEVQRMYDTISSALAALGIDLTAFALNLSFCADAPKVLLATRSAQLDTQPSADASLIAPLLIGGGVLGLFFLALRDKKNN